MVQMITPFILFDESFVMMALIWPQISLFLIGRSLARVVSESYWITMYAIKIQYTDDGDVATDERKFSVTKRNAFAIFVHCIVYSYIF